MQKMVTRAAKILLIIDWLPSYTTTNAVNDLVAAASVTIMLAGLPPHIGLYASILPSDS